MKTAKSIPPDSPIDPEKSSRGVYRAVAVSIGLLGQEEYAAIYLDEREVLRAASGDYQMLLEAVNELNAGPCQTCIEGVR